MVHPVSGGGIPPSHRPEKGEPLNPAHRAEIKRQILVITASQTSGSPAEQIKNIQQANGTIDNVINELKEARAPNHRVINELERIKDHFKDAIDALNAGNPAKAGQDLKKGFEIVDSGIGGG